MRFLIFLLVLALLATPFLTYYLGHTVAERQAGENHRAMYRFMIRLLESDNIVALLTAEQREDAQKLVYDFDDNTHPGDSR